MENGSVSRDRMALLESKIVTKGSNKPNVHEDALASSPNTVVKAKVSRAPRTSSIMLLDSSLKAHSSASVQGLEQPANLNKVSVPGVAESQKRQMSAGSSSHAMAQWVGQRPHKNARTRRANIVAPVSSHDEGQISSQGFSASDISVRTSVGTSRSAIASTQDDIAASKVKREVESITSTFGLSESEESGAGENKMKDKVTDNGEVTLTTSQKPGAFLLPGRKNKLTTNENGDGVRRQGRSGRDSSSSRPGFPQVREKLENLPTTKPMPSVKPASERNKSKTGRPPSKKLKDQRALSRVGPMLNGSSLDLTAESDDREELFVAAKSARNASDLACSSPFWKEMESLFASISSKDMAYLKQQLSLAEELDESLSQILGIGYNASAVLEHKVLCGNSGERLCDNPNQDSIKIVSLPSRVDVGKLEKCAPLYQRVLSALIEEDESEEFYIHGEGKNISLHDASDDSHCGSCNLIDFETKDRDRIESEVESKVNFQSQKNCFLDRTSCNNKSVAYNTFGNPSMLSSFHGPEQWLVEDDSSHSDIVHISEISSTDLFQPQMRESSLPSFSSSNNQYQQMSLEDRLLLELQSIGLCPETLPDLAEEEVINQDIIELKEGLYRQIGRKRRKLGKIDKALQKGIQEERRNLEKVAMDQLVEMAYRKRLACRGNNNSKGAMRKVSRQVALAFVKRTVARCKKFEDTGSNCFSDPAMQDAMFSSPLCNNDAKSADGVGSGTASNTCNEVTNHHPEARGSGAVSSTLERHDSFGDNISRGKRREVLIDDVIGSASSRVTATLDSSIPGGVKGKRSDRERDQSKDNLRSTVVSVGVRSSLDNIKSERKTKPKPKQKNNQVSTSVNGLHGSSNGVAKGSNKVDRGMRSTSLGNVPNDASKGDELSSLQLPELDTIGLGEPQDIALWLNIDEDGLQDHDSIGLDIPMDDLSELNMLM
uniref:Uncharacterized protein LOC105640155 isoform X4 n=2 Tax=Rhizophora mucronata TaxID=61149 RepID=A0A2P2MTB0_RHIMU